MEATDSPEPGRQPVGLPADGLGGQSPGLPPLSRTVTVVVAAVLGLTLAALLLDGRRTTTGELLVQADSGTVLVSIRRGGRVIIPATEKRSFTLTPGDYEVVLEDEEAGRRAVPSRVRVAQSGRTVVRIEGPQQERPTDP